ncbi:MAG: hypothetical protein NVSMB27_11520 [Ktedonobacteraceae bacterium]
MATTIAATPIIWLCRAIVTLSLHSHVVHSPSAFHRTPSFPLLRVNIQKFGNFGSVQK